MESKITKLAVAALIIIAIGIFFPRGNGGGSVVWAKVVENVEQIQFLAEQACYEVQGFYFSKPVPAEEFAELFLKSQEMAKKHQA